MKNKKRTVTIAAVITALTLAICGGFMAWGHGRHFGRHFPEKLLSHVDGRVEGLELNPSQQAQYQALRKQLETNLFRAQTKRRKAFKEVKQALSHPDPDIKAVTGMIKKRLNMAPGLIGANLDLLAEFYAILDEGQKVKVLTITRKRIECIERFAFAGEGGEL